MIKKLPEEEQIRILGVKYEMTAAEVRRYLAEGFRYMDLDKAAFYAWAADVSLDDVLALRREDPWGIIERKLGLNPQKVETARALLRARCMKRWWGFDEARTYAALGAGYPVHWVKVAWLLSEKSGMKMETILRTRKRTQKWGAWAEENLGIPGATVMELIKAHRNPTLPKKEEKA